MRVLRAHGEGAIRQRDRAQSVYARAALADVDYVTFTSASSVRNLLASLGGPAAPDVGFASPGHDKATSSSEEGSPGESDVGLASPGHLNQTSGVRAAAAMLDQARIVSIGPVTTEQARELGLTVDVEADRHDVDGLVDALIADTKETP